MIGAYEYVCIWGSVWSEKMMWGSKWEWGLYEYAILHNIDYVTFVSGNWEEKCYKYDSKNWGF